MAKREVHAVLAVLAGLSVFGAAPSIVQESVRLWQPRDHRARISYVLSDGPAIVTVDIQTNNGAGAWASIGAENFRSLTGDVNKVVPAGSATREIRWDARADWSDRVVPMGGIRAEVTAWNLRNPPDYMVVDITDGSRAFYASADAVPKGVGDFVYKSDKIVMRKIPAAGVCWKMGSEREKVSGFAAEPLHEVTFSEDFYLGIYELTQGQYSNLVMHTTWGSRTNYKSVMPSSYNGADRSVHPLETVSFNTFRDAGGTDKWPQSGHDVGSGSFLAALRAQTGIRFDLPTSAQWEYACRAGTPHTNKFFFDAETWDDEYGWVLQSTTCAVGTKLANPWGLYDMYGNIGDYCLDWYRSNGFASQTADPVGPDAIGTGGDEHYSRNGVEYGKRTSKGGLGEFSGEACRTASAYRQEELTAHRWFGYRLCCPAVVPE